MRYFFRFLTFVAGFTCTIVLVFVYIGLNIIPDTITVVDETNYVAPKVFGLKVYSSSSSNQVNILKDSSQITQKNSQIELLNIIPIKDVKITNSKRKYVILGGEVFGIKLYTNGVIVVGIDDIETENGAISPADTAGLKVGDVIKKYNDVSVNSTKHFSALLQGNQGDEATLTILRDDGEMKVKFQSVKEINSGKYKAGLWVRDSTAGIGTVTFYNPENNSFAGLGHAICDIDTGEIMPLKNGEMAEAYVSSFYKSSSGSIGELCGVLTGKTNGQLCLNDETGIYGFVTEKVNGELVPVAVKQEIEEGNAKILCTIDKNPPKYYDVKITKIFSNSNSVNKDVLIEITDENLIKQTGGILQGMSGSPIIQNGKLIGAVTHVLVDDPTRGYAIFAENMLETAQSVADQRKLKEAS